MILNIKKKVFMSKIINFLESSLKFDKLSKMTRYKIAGKKER